MYAVTVVPSMRYARVVCLLRVWFVAVGAAVVAAVAGVSLSSWTYVDAVGNGTNYYQDIGLWRTCHLEYSPGNKSNISSSHGPRLECTSLDQTIVSGWYRAVQVLCTLSTAVSCCAAVGLCAVLIYTDTWHKCRRQFVVVTCITIILWLAAGTEFAGVIVHEVKSNKTLLPVCITWCPVDVQPMTSCLNSSASAMETMPSCVSQLGPGYFAAVVAAGFDLLAAVMGVIVICMSSLERRRCSRFDVDKDCPRDDGTGSEVDERQRLIPPSRADVN